MPGFRVCFDLLITILGTPEDGLAKLPAPRPPCSTTAFPGSPNGFSLQTFSESPFESSSLCIIWVQQHLRAIYPAEKPWLALWFPLRCEAQTNSANAAEEWIF